MSEVGQVEPSEYPVPVSVIALGGKEFVPRWTHPAGCGEQPAEGQAFLVRPVGLRIPDQEVFPMAPPHVRVEAIGVGAEL